MSDEKTEQTPKNRTPQVIDNHLSSSDMGVMTIIVAIAVICIAVYVMANIMNPSSKSNSSSIASSQDISQAQVTEFYDLPDGVAAYVNEVEIPESKIDDYVATYRLGMGLEDDEDWAKYVSDTFGETEGVRNYMLEHYINQEIVRQSAEKLGLSITEEEINDRIAKDMADRNFETEDQFWTWIANSGSSKDDYLSLIENEMYQDKIIGYVLPEESYADTIDDQILAYIKQSFPAYANINSLDEVSQNIIDSSREYVVYYLKVNAYNKVIDDFMEISDIRVGRPQSDELSYQADTGKYQLENLINTFKRSFELAQQDKDSGKSEAEPMDQQD